MPSPTAKELVEQLQRTEDPARLVEVFVLLCAKGRRCLHDAMDALEEERFLELWSRAGRQSAGRLLEAVLRADFRRDDDGAELLRALPAGEMGRKAVEFVGNRRFEDAAFILAAVPDIDPDVLLELSRAYLKANSPREALTIAQRALDAPGADAVHLAAEGALAAAKLGETEEAVRLLGRGFAGAPSGSRIAAAPALAVLVRSGATADAERAVQAVGGLTPELEDALRDMATSLARADLGSVEVLLRSLMDLLHSIHSRAVCVTDPRTLPEETARIIESLAAEGLDRCMGLTRLFEAWQGPQSGPVKARLLLLNMLTALSPSDGSLPEAVLDEGLNGRIIYTDDSLLSFALREMLRSALAAGGRRIVAGCTTGEDGHDELRFTVEKAPAAAPREWRAEIARKICDELGVRAAYEVTAEGAVLRFSLPVAPEPTAADQAAGGLAAVVRRATRDERSDTAEVLSFLVHDLKNGFSFIGHWAGEVESAKHPLGTVQERILENIAKMEGYIDECLKYLALQGETSVDQFSLEEALREVARLLGGSCARKGVGLAIDVTPGLPSYRGQRDRILSVLLNLAKNSLEALDGPGQLTLKVHLDADGQFELLVRDNGPGISPDAQKRLFQLGGKPVRGSGRGIGLWAVRRHLDREGGSIAVESSEAGGTTFRIILPGPAGIRATPDEPDASRLEGETAQAWRAASELSAAAPNPPWDTVTFLVNRAVQTQFLKVFRPLEKRGSLAATALKLIETGPKGSRRGRVLPGLVQHIEAKYPWAKGGPGVEEPLRRVLRAIIDDNLEREIEDFRSMAVWLLAFGRNYRVGGADVSALVNPPSWTEGRLEQLAQALVELDLAGRESSALGAFPADTYARLRGAAGRALKLMQKD